jgi:D-hexose-6-phosphate mutarotase
MKTAKQLNDEFGIDGQLSFREHHSGLVVADVKNAMATASLCLQGGHLMTWAICGQETPVIWLSRDARLAAGKSIRGGVPICWPWFGPHATEASFPGHGFARTVPWKVMEAGVDTRGATRIALRLVESETTVAQWRHPCYVDLTITVGESLLMELTTENTGSGEFVVGEAFHTYFQISDIGAVRVSGLGGAHYWDKVGPTTLVRQDGEISFSGETDRVYVDTTSECIIEDPQLKRRIRISKSGSKSTVVWTPWEGKAKKMGDMGEPDGWRQMVCVETANAIGNIVKVAPGSKHTMMVRYDVESA